jgi:hypothetical protein
MKIPKTTEEEPYIKVLVTPLGNVRLRLTDFKPRYATNYRAYICVPWGYETVCSPQKATKTITYLLTQRQKYLKENISRLEKQINRLEKTKEKWKNTNY